MSVTVFKNILQQVVGSLEELSARVDELKQVGPALVDAVLPLGQRGGLRVSALDQRVDDLVDRVHALLAHCACLPGELTELVPQNLTSGAACEEQRNTVQCQ